MLTDLQLQTAKETTSIIVRGIEAKSVPDEAFLRALRKLRYPEMGLLPPVVRWISKSRKMILFERPPGIQLFQYTNAKPFAISGGAKVRQQVFELPMPWTLYAIELDDFLFPSAISCFALQHRMESWADPIGILPLPNHYESGGICLPPRNPETDPEPQTVADGIAAAHAAAWASGFNTDLSNAIARCMKYKKPRELWAAYSPDGEPATAARIARSWERLGLADVANITDWCPPSGYGAGVGGVVDPAPMSTIAHLVNILSRREAERTDNPPTTVTNVLLRVQAALNYAALE